MKKQVGAHRLCQRLLKREKQHYPGTGGLRRVLCGVRAPKPMCSPDPAKEYITLTSGDTDFQAALVHVLLASNQQTVSQCQHYSPFRFQKMPPPSAPAPEPWAQVVFVLGDTIHSHYVPQILNHFSQLHSLCLIQTFLISPHIVTHCLLPSALRSQLSNSASLHPSFQRVVDLSRLVPILSNTHTQPQLFLKYVHLLSPLGLCQASPSRRERFSHPFLNALVSLIPLLSFSIQASLSLESLSWLPGWASLCVLCSCVLGFDMLGCHYWRECLPQKAGSPRGPGDLSDSLLCSTAQHNGDDKETGSPCSLPTIWLKKQHTQMHPHMHAHLQLILMHSHNHTVPYTHTDVHQQTLIQYIPFSTHAHSHSYKHTYTATWPLTAEPV